MANPSLVACPADQWTPVVMSAIKGAIEPTKSVTMRFTWRDAGSAAPTLLAEGTLCPPWLPIKTSKALDVYIWAEKEAGQVRLYP